MRPTCVKEKNEGRSKSRGGGWSRAYRAKYNAIMAERKPHEVLGPNWGAKPEKRSGGAVVEAAIAAGSVGVAEAIAGEVAVLRVK